MAEVLNAVGLIASIASLVLAVIAIWLAIVFYKLSRDQAEQSGRNANEIAQSVSRLEKVFDGLYSDTFAIMKDTVTDMRRHIWHRNPDTEPVSKPQEESAREDAVLKKLDELSSQLGIATDKANQLKAGLEPVVRESVEGGPSDALRKVRRYLARRNAQDAVPVTLSQLRRRLPEVEPNALVGALFDLRNMGIVTWDSEPNTLGSSDLIIYRDRAASGSEMGDAAPAPAVN